MPRFFLETIAEDDIRITGGHDVFGGHQPLFVSCPPYRLCFADATGGTSDGLCK